MRVLQLAQFYPPVVGGEERHVRNLSVELASRGHEVHVACLDVGEPPVSDPGVTVHPLANVGARVPALYPTADRPLALPLPDPYVSRALSRLAADLRPDVVHAHNWIVNSWLPLPAARRLPLVCSLHDYSHVCPNKRLMFMGAEPCSGPGLVKCFRCTTEWYGAGRGPVIQSMVRTGRPVRNRVVDVFTPVSTYVARANQLDEQGVRWQVVPNFVPDYLLSAAPPRDPALPEATTSSTPATCPSRRAWTLSCPPTPVWTRRRDRPCCWSAGRHGPLLACPRARAPRTSGTTTASSPASPRAGGGPALASGRTPAPPPCWRRWPSARRW